MGGRYTYESLYECIARSVLGCGQFDERVLLPPVDLRAKKAAEKLRFPHTVQKSGIFTPRVLGVHTLLDILRTI